MGSSIAGPRVLKGAGVWNTGFTLSWEGLGMKELSSLLTSPRMPPRSGQNELTGKAPPVPMEMSRELTKTAGSAQHGHRLHHPLLRWGAQK